MQGIICYFMNFFLYLGRVFPEEDTGWILGYRCCEIVHISWDLELPVSNFSVLNRFQNKSRDTLGHWVFGARVG